MFWRVMVALILFEVLERKNAITLAAAVITDGIHSTLSVAVNAKAP
jgi:uncharacterized protein YdaT